MARVEAYQNPTGNILFTEFVSGLKDCQEVKVFVHPKRKILPKPRLVWTNAEYRVKGAYGEKTYFEDFSVLPGFKESAKKGSSFDNAALTVLNRIDRIRNRFLGVKTTTAVRGNFSAKRRSMLGMMFDSEIMVIELKRRDPIYVFGGIPENQILTAEKIDKRIAEEFPGSLERIEQGRRDQLAETAGKTA